MVVILAEVARPVIGNMKQKTYNFKVKVTKSDDNTYSVAVEGAGLQGTSTSSALGNAFERAYQSVIDQASELILKDG